MGSIKRVERMLARGQVQGLCRALHDRNALVRRRAAQALGEMGQPEGVPCLHRALSRDSDQYVVRWSIEALAAIGGTEAVEALALGMFSTRRQIVSRAGQALAEMDDPLAQVAITLRDILTQNDWGALREQSGYEVRRMLGVILRSEQYQGWPSAKRKQVLNFAVGMGETPPDTTRRDLAQMGVFVSGVHTVGDLVRSLGQRSPEVRIAAAGKLATGEQRWVVGPLYRRFRREARPGGEQQVAVAYARALDQLGDTRAVGFYKSQLYQAEGPRAAEAARRLAEIGTPAAIQTLFRFVAQPPPPPAYRNVAVVLSALESTGPAATAALSPLAEHDSAAVRRLLVDVIERSGSPEAIPMLAKLCLDGDPDVQRSALDALAGLDSGEAARQLLALADEVPRMWVVRSLATMTHPEAVGSLRALAPEATTLRGVLLEDNRQPHPRALVQLVEERYFGTEAGWSWQAISARAKTDAEGMFALTVIGGDNLAQAHLKVTTLPHQAGVDSETFLAKLPLSKGRFHYVETRIDRFFGRLVAHVEQVED
jgi:HEAT repeat protein